MRKAKVKVYTAEVIDFRRTYFSVGIEGLEFKTKIEAQAVARALRIAVRNLKLPPKTRPITVYR